MPKIIVNIFIVGNEYRNVKTIENFKLAAKNLADGYQWELKVVDILKDHRSVEKMKIFATPTIVIKHQQIERRIIGELKDAENATKALEYLTQSLAKTKPYATATCVSALTRRDRASR